MIIRYWISWTQSCRFISFQNTHKSCFLLCRIHHSHNFSQFYRAKKSHWFFQLLTCVLDGFLEFRILGVDEMDSSQFSCVFKVELFIEPLLLLLQLGVLSHWLPELSPEMILPACFLWSCQFLPDTKIRLEIALPMKQTEWHLSKNQTNFLTHRCSDSRRCFAQHPNSCEFFWTRFCVWMIHLSASEVRLWVQRDGGKWYFLTWTKNQKPLHKHPEMSRWVLVETFPILQKSHCYFFRELNDAVSRWMFSVPDLLHWFWFVHLRLEKTSFPFSQGNITSFALSLFEQISDASIVSNSSRSAISTSPFQIPPA